MFVLEHFFLFLFDLDAPSCAHDSECGQGKRCQKIGNGGYRGFSNKFSKKQYKRKRIGKCVPITKTYAEQIQSDPGKNASYKYCLFIEYKKILRNGS